MNTQEVNWNYNSTLIIKEKIATNISDLIERIQRDCNFSNHLEWVANFNTEQMQQLIDTLLLTASVVMSQEMSYIDFESTIWDIDFLVKHCQDREKHKKAIVDTTSDMINQAELLKILFALDTYGSAVVISWFDDEVTFKEITLWKSKRSPEEKQVVTKQIEKSIDSRLKEHIERVCARTQKALWNGVVNISLESKQKDAELHDIKINIEGVRYVVEKISKHLEFLLPQNKSWVSNFLRTK